MPIELACAQCKQAFLVQEAFSGEAVECPSCGYVTRVPDAVAATVVPTAGSTGSAPRPTRRSRPWLWVAAICAGALCLPFCCCVGVTLFPQYQLQQQFEAQRQAQKAAVESGVTPPVELPRPLRRGVAAKGTTVYLAVRGNSEVWICRDEKAMDELQAASSAGNEDAINQLVKAQRVLMGPKNMRAVVVDPGISTYRVRVLDGKWQNREGLIAAEFVHDREVP